MLFFVASPTIVAQDLVFDFDTVAPTTTEQLPDFFDVYGFDAEFGDGDDPLDNDYYFVRVGVDNGPPSTVTLYKTQDGLNDELFQVTDEPFPVSTGETHKLSVKATTIGDAVEIFVSLDDEPVFGLDPFIDDFDPLLGPGRVGVGQETNPTFFDNITIVGAGGPPGLLPGDSNQDLKFDQIDLVQVQIAAKYLTGQPATWGEADWDGAPGGEPGNPPMGDGQFNQLDIIAALGPGHYLTGPYAAIGPGGQPGDEQTSIVYNVSTGEVAVDAPAGKELTSINIDSAAGVFTGAPAENLGGSFDNDADNNIFKATFGSSFGSLTFGNVAQAGLSQEFVLNDLTVIGSLAGGGDLGNVDLIYVPEPTTLALVVLGLATMLCLKRGLR